MSRDAIEIRIGLELQRLRGDLRRMRSDFNQAFSGIQKSAQTLRRALIGAFSGLSAAAVARSIIRVGVEMDSLRRRLRAVSDGQKEFADALRFVRSEADRLGQNFQELLRSYIDFRAATRAANLDLRTTQEIFTAFSETITVLGLSSEEAGRIFLALRQMISGGVLQMQELNQIAESLPGAIDVFAQALGVSVQELRKLTSEARINATRALIRVAQVLRERFGRDVAESAGSARAAFNRLSTAWQQFADAIATSGVLDALVDGINRLRQVLTDPNFIDGIRSLTNNLISGFSEAVKHGAQLLKVLAIIKTTVTGARLGGRFGFIGALTGGLAGAGAGAVALEEIDRLLKDLAPSSREAARAAERYTEQVYRLRQQLDLATEAANQWRQALDSVRESGSLAGMEHARKELERWRFIAAEVRKQLEALAKGSAPNSTPNLPQQQHTGLPPPITDQPEKIDLGRIREQLRQIDAEILQLQGRTVEAARVALEAQFSDLVAKLRKIGDEAGLAKVQKFIDLSVARERIESLRDDYTRFRDQVSQALEQINQKVQLGILSQREGQAELSRIYQDAIGRLRRFQEQAAQLPGSEAFIAELRNAVLETQVQLQQLQDQFGQFFMGLRDDLQGAFSSLFLDLIQGTRSLKDALLNFVRSVYASIQRRIAERAADALTKALLGDRTKDAFDQLLNHAVGIFQKMGSSLTSILGDAISGLSGAFGNLFSGFGSFFAGLFHDGRGFSGKRIQGPVVAPRLHQGLMPDEFLAVLQKGEVVLPKQVVAQLRANRSNEAQSRPVVINNHFTIRGPITRESEEQIAAKAAMSLSNAARRLGR